MPRMQQYPGNNMLIGGEGGSTFVNGDQLKQADVPIETLLGAANGAVSGAVISSIASAAVTAAKVVRDNKDNMSKVNMRGIVPLAMTNIVGNHLIAVLSGTAALAALGALVRNSRARKHNEWTEKHYAYLEQQNGGHADRVDQTREQNAAPAGNVR